MSGRPSTFPSKHRPEEHDSSQTMAHTKQAILAVVIVLIALIAAAWGYSQMGWETFSYATGDTPSWSAAKNGGGYSPNGIGDLRFKNATFTLSVPGNGGSTDFTQDVTPVLNGMAVAYRNTPYDGNVNTGTLLLDSALNPFSFVIPGENDRATITDPSVLSTATVTLTGRYKVL